MLWEFPGILGDLGKEENTGIPGKNCQVPRGTKRGNSPGIPGFFESWEFPAKSQEPVPRGYATKLINSSSNNK